MLHCISQRTNGLGRWAQKELQIISVASIRFFPLIGSFHFGRTVFLAHQTKNDCARHSHWTTFPFHSYIEQICVCEWINTDWNICKTVVLTKKKEQKARGSDELVTRGKHILLRHLYSGQSQVKCRLPCPFVNHMTILHGLAIFFCLFVFTNTIITTVSSNGDN